MHFGALEHGVISHHGVLFTLFKNSPADFADSYSLFLSNPIFACVLFSISLVSSPVYHVLSFIINFSAGVNVL